MPTHLASAARALAALTLLATGCLPYSVASTADPTPRGETQPTAIWFAIPNGVNAFGDSSETSLFGGDAEVRFGLDDYSDLGMRLTSASGIVATYKRRLDAPSGTDQAAVAIMGGMGFVNMGSHVHFELTVLGSARQRMVTPYGGLRAMQVAPLNRSAVHDEPSLGGFFGLRIGRQDMAFSPEVAVYYDRSALGIRDRNIIVVPSIAAHGEELIRLIGIVLGAVR